MPDHDEHTYALDAFEHPIDLIETLAVNSDWLYERIDDQIALEFEGLWRIYSVTLAWGASNTSLRLVCVFDLQPPEKKLPILYETLNAINMHCWHGGFWYMKESSLMLWQNALPLHGCDMVSLDQVQYIIDQAVIECERFYPCMQLVCWGNKSPAEAIQMAMTEAYGHA